MSQIIGLVTDSPDFSEHLKWSPQQNSICHCKVKYNRATSQLEYLASWQIGNAQ